LIVLEKEYMKQNVRRIVDKVVENLTQGRWIPIDSMKSWDYFDKFGHKSGDMGYIESDEFNLAYLVG